MKIERKKNAARNVAFGIILRVYNMILPFIMRTVMIYTLGVEYLGLNSLFTSILQVLNLAELGVGSAMVFSMYKPIAEDDKDQINALIKLYRYYYRIIGAVVLVAGLVILPFIPKLISGDVPADINVYVLYFLNLLATVFTYWLFAYRNSILNAYQRTDVISKITLITNTIQYGIQIAVLYLLKNYYLYVIAILATQILNNILTAIISKKMYPEYDPKGDLPKEEIRSINQRVKDVFTSKVGGTILNSADTIVISAFLGLRALAIYQNYYYIMSAVMAIFSIFFSSLTAGIGNSLITESKEKNYKDYRKVTLMTFIGMAICMSEMLSLYQPFMKIWVGEKLMLGFPMVVLFCVYFFCVEYVMLASAYKDAAGIWHEDRFRPLISGLANLAMNIAMVHFWGLYGIIISTILSSGLISAPWITHNLFSLIFKGKFKNYLPKLIYETVMVILTMVISFIIGNFIPASNIALLLVRAVVVLIVSSAVIFLMTYKMPEFQSLKQMARSFIKRR
ncbi:oligosaccharide flippase family protein [Stecheria sp. CLA-KB-P133]|uniref:Oligosaccharide flippase family protein n=1 Tax=Grylomicrobium aquisgranensis TaxID=2926318 RepID=A0AB35U3I5_9FIRM|nr:oligosaccharide flippase family protein [Stecheria sp. CLA-KB-P133]